MHRRDIIVNGTIPVCVNVGGWGFRPRRSNSYVPEKNKKDVTRGMVMMIDGRQAGRMHCGQTDGGTVHINSIARPFIHVILYALHGTERN